MPWNNDLEDGSPVYNLALSTAKTIVVVGGPGTGKSFGIQRRIARLLEDGIVPETILTFAFSRSAANELKREIVVNGIVGADKIHTRTVHAHALEILTTAGFFETINRFPRVAIDHEIEPALKDISNAEYGGVREKAKLKEACLTAWAGSSGELPKFTLNEIEARFEKDLIEWLIFHRSILPEEIVPTAIGFLKNNPEFGEIGAYQEIVVDDYQDLTRNDHEFIRLIRGSANLVLVGDNNQSIYKFKSAFPKGIREFEKLHGRFEKIRFKQCRRCPAQVTAMASSLISKNPIRTHGSLVSNTTNQNGIVQVVQWNTYDEEIEGLCSLIKDEIESGAVMPEDVLVLCPRKRIGHRIRDKLATSGFQVRSYFIELAIEKESIKRAYSLLSFLANSNDLLSLRFLLGTGSSEYRRNQYELLIQIASQHNSTTVDVLNEILEGKIDDKNLKTIVAEFRIILQDTLILRKEMLSNPESALQTFFVKTDEDETEFNELAHLYKIALIEVGVAELTNPQNFDNWIKKVFLIIKEGTVVSKFPTDINHIRIMSLQSSKEYSAKFIILSSMIDPFMPSISHSIGDTSSVYEDTVEEQRRLLYVAITRCKTSNEYPGRLLISSFSSIRGTEAVKLTIEPTFDTILSPFLRISPTRFLREFVPIAGDILLDKNNKC